MDDGPATEIWSRPIAPSAITPLWLDEDDEPAIFSTHVYHPESLPFPALAANAISQDGDALFPLIAMDKKAAVIASIYTTVPALLVGIGLHLLFGPLFGFGVLGG